MFTEAEIREVIGLRDPDKFALAVVRRNTSRKAQAGRPEARVLKELWRGTGRTTQLVVQALVKVSEGEQILFVGPTLVGAKQITDQAREWARVLRFNPKLILAARTEATARGASALVFRDVF